MTETSRKGGTSTGQQQKEGLSRRRRWQRRWEALSGENRERERYRDTGGLVWGGGRAVLSSTASSGFAAREALSPAALTMISSENRERKRGTEIPVVGDGGGPFVCQRRIRGSPQGKIPLRRLSP
ncbi:hypothetical protein TIFTF001_038394 [Ficus carica]|uniref:Uncharacterized protein n=1 Tax=Ficus carica TaxID=3494 RepID=A0AA88EIH7_FICCA|nr:hypothetical protein TIFTF001_038394 [Ficus carica]